MTVPEPRPPYPTLLQMAGACGQEPPESLVACRVYLLHWAECSRGCGVRDGEIRECPTGAELRVAAEVEFAALPPGRRTEGWRTRPATVRPPESGEEGR